MEEEDFNKTGYLNKFKRNLPTNWKLLGFAMLPTKILFDERLSRSCMVVFWVLTVHLFHGKKYAFPSISTIQKESHASRPTVIKAIKELEAAGYLEVERVGRTVNKYFLKVRV